MKITNLQANHLHRALGIDPWRVRLSWCLSDCVAQSAFQVEFYFEGQRLFRSEKRLTNQMHYTLPAPLPYGCAVTLLLRCWDEQNNCCEASLPVLTTVEPGTWQAMWIDPELEEPTFVECEAKPDFRSPDGQSKPAVTERRPGSYLKKEFTLEALPQSCALLHITAHGIADVYINGAPATDVLFLPGTSEEAVRLNVYTLDVTDKLRAGHNEILVTLGDGWHRGSMGHDQNKDVYGTDVALLCQLEIGKKIILCSDETWLASNDGPLGLNDMMMGEHFDARKAETMTWHGVKIRDFGYDNLVPMDTVPVTAHERFSPRLIVTPAGEQVLDFGQIIAGFVEMDFHAHAGQTVKLVHGEVLTCDGNFTIENFQNGANPSIRTHQEVIYTCREGRNHYHPTKVFFGFQYVKVDADFPIDPCNFTAVAVYSDMPVTGHFRCGVEAVNKLFSNALWAMKGNFLHIPTDCPTREKSGFTGDAQAYVHTAMYLMDCHSVYGKFIAEQAAGQYEDGAVPQISPRCNRERTIMDGGVGWSDSFVIVPYMLARHYNDISLAKKYFPQIKKWLTYRENMAKITRPCNEALLPSHLHDYMLDYGWMWGEWLEPGVDCGREYLIDILTKGDTEDGTAYLYCGAHLAAQMAQQLGYGEDAAYYNAYAEKVRQAYYAMYMKNGRIEEPKRQCRYVRPVDLDILTEEEKKQTVADLAALIRSQGNHLGTGFLTTHALCRTLSDYGQAQTAYDLLLQDECPGWLYSVLQGATAIPENWDSYGPDGSRKSSFNHYSYGAVAGWLLDSVCGIRLKNGRITVTPCPDPRLGFAQGRYDSPFGTIESGWEYRDSVIRYNVTVPANTTLTFNLPDGSFVLQPGTHHFERNYE